MNAKEVLEKSYKCKNIAELIGLFNDGVIVGRGDIETYTSYDQSEGKYKVTSYDYPIYRVTGNTWAKQSVKKNTEWSQSAIDEILQFPQLPYHNILSDHSYWTGHVYEKTNTYSVSDEKCQLVYFAPQGELYQTEFYFKAKEGATVQCRDYGGDYYAEEDIELVVKKWKLVDNVVRPDVLCFQPVAAIWKWFEENHPYAYKWYKNDLLGTINYEESPYRYARNHGIDAYDVKFIATHPEVELLSKMVINGQKGLACLKSVMQSNATKEDRRMYGRCFKTGKNASEIFVRSMDVVRTLWNKPEIKTWDTVRKMMNLRGCSVDDIRLCEEDNWSADQYTQIDEILRKKWDDKPIFTFTTLLNYLRKIDVNEAISLRDGIWLIKDTIEMAKAANQYPDFNTDSLKRTHDIMMRNARYVRDEKISQGIKDACTNKYFFEYGKYFIRQIKDYEDLMDEGEQQANCLRWAYSSRIANKESLIYVMRLKAEPNKSLISVELNPEGTVVRQKLARFNNPVTQPSQLQFFEAWDKHREKINAKEDSIL
jgi:hypothetical protein